MPGGDLPVALDHFANDQLHQPLHDGRIQLGLLSKCCQTLVLLLLSGLVYRRQLISGLEQSDLIGTAKPFREQVDEGGVDIVDGFPEC
jgi:hypothetical protein